MKDWRTYLAAAVSTLAITTTGDFLRVWGVFMALALGFVALLVAKKERDFEKWVEREERRKRREERENK